MTITKEMQDALKADGDKLRALTGEDHGPYFETDCTCRMSTVNTATVDPPELIPDPWCPVHGGRDPDEEYERKRDDADWEQYWASDCPGDAT